jgi:ZIP family zinc transporter
MSGLWGTLLLSLLPGVGNFLGGVLAEVTKTPARLLNQALHASAGLLVAMVAVEFTPESPGPLGGHTSSGEYLFFSVPDKSSVQTIYRRL